MQEEVGAVVKVVRDPTTYPIITYIWVLLLSTWGGLVSFLKKRQTGEARPFNLVELIGEIVTSALAGLITFFLCEASGINPLITAAMVGVSGHMGSRAIYQFEIWMQQKFGIRETEK